MGPIAVYGRRETIRTIAGSIGSAYPDPHTKQSRLGELYKRLGVHLGAPETIEHGVTGSSVPEQRDGSSRGRVNYGEVKLRYDRNKYCSKTIRVTTV